MFLSAYIGAPPTIGFSAANSVAAAASPPRRALVRYFLIIGCAPFRTLLRARSSVGLVVARRLPEFGRSSVDALALDASFANSATLVYSCAILPPQPKIFAFVPAASASLMSPLRL